MARDEAYCVAVTALRLDVARVDPVMESYSSDVYSLVLSDGTRAVLKVPYSREKLGRELTALRLLKKVVPVPDVLGVYGGSNQVRGALLLEYVEGEPVIGCPAPEIARDMGVMLARIHQVHRNGYELEPDKPGSYSRWWDSVALRVDRWVGECECVLGSSSTERCKTVFGDLCDALPEPDGPCLVHLDYRPGNILSDGQSLTAIIDFESARGGSADMDFTKPYLYILSRSPESREAFMDGYGSVRPVPKIELTLPLYMMANALGGVAWSIRRKQTDSAFFKENMDQLNDILVQH